MLLKEVKRVRLQTLARALTEKNNLLVRFGENPSTNLTDLQLRDPDMEIMPGVPCSPAERWVASKAACAHESAHVLFTARGVMEEAAQEGPLLQHILNALEDARVERAMANAYPGTLGWFRFANEYIYRNRQDWGKGAQAFLWGLCAHAMIGRVPNALDRETKGLIEKCKPLVDKARLAASTWEVLQYAEKVCALVKDAFPAPDLPPVAIAGTDNPREAPVGHLDPRGISRENNHSSGEPQGDDTGSGSREGSKNELETSEEDSSFGGSCSEESGDGDAGPDEQDSPGLNRDSEGEDDSSGEGGEDSTGPSGWDGNQDDAGGSEENLADQDDRPEPRLSGNGGGDGDKGSPENREPGTPATPEPGDSGEDKEENPGDGDFSSLLEEAKNELSKMENSAARQEKEAARRTVPEPDWEKVEAELSQDLHAGCRFKWCDLLPAPRGYQGLVQAQQGTIRRLTEEIRKALEFKATVPRRNLKKGRLDTGSLWKLRVPDPKVFSRREAPGNVPAVAVYLLVDCSGSMAWPAPCDGDYARRIVPARAAACVLHEACNALGVPHTVVGFNSSYPETRFYRAARWDDRDGGKIPSLQPSRGNRDGYAVRVVAKELELRPEPRKVLVVLSDGLPCDDWDDKYLSYTGGPPDTARAMREIERKGIGVVGLFFGDEADVPNARRIYNRFIFVQDVGHLPTILGRVLKEAITGGA